MNKLKTKLKNSKGFTLVEMLIVVAIIAILIAISIPLISATLERAREGVDNANERSAVSLAYAYYMTTTKASDLEAFGKDDGLVLNYGISQTGSTTETGATTGTVNEGWLYPSTVTPDGYGKGTKLGDNPNSHVGGYIQVKIKHPTDTVDPTTVSASNIVTVTWVIPTGG